MMSARLGGSNEEQDTEHVNSVGRRELARSQRSRAGIGEALRGSGCERWGSAKGWREMGRSEPRWNDMYVSIDADRPCTEVRKRSRDSRKGASGERSRANESNLRPDSRSLSNSFLLRPLCSPLKSRLLARCIPSYSKPSPHTAVHHQPLASSPRAGRLSPLAIQSTTSSSPAARPLRVSPRSRSPGAAQLPKQYRPAQSIILTYSLHRGPSNSPWRAPSSSHVRSLQGCTVSSRPQSSPSRPTRSPAWATWTAILSRNYGEVSRFSAPNHLARQWRFAQGARGPAAAPGLALSVSQVRWSLTRGLLSPKQSLPSARIRCKTVVDWRTSAGAFGSIRAVARTPPSSPLTTRRHATLPSPPPMASHRPRRRDGAIRNGPKLPTVNQKASSSLHR